MLEFADLQMLSIYRIFIVKTTHVDMVIPCTE